MLCGDRLAFLEPSITMQIIFTGTTESWRTLKSEMWSKYRSNTLHSQFVKEGDAALSHSFLLCSTPVHCSVHMTSPSTYTLSPEHVAPPVSDTVRYVKQAGRDQRHLLEGSEVKLNNECGIFLQASTMKHHKLLWNQYNKDSFSQTQPMQCGLLGQVTHVLISMG